MECCRYRSRLTPFSLGELVVVAKWLQFGLHPPVLGLPTSDYMLDKMPMSYKYTISRAPIASCLISWAAMLMVPSRKPTTQINFLPDIKTSNRVLQIQGQAHAVQLRRVNRRSKVIIIWSSSSRTRLADQWPCVRRNSHVLQTYNFTSSNGLFLDFF